MNLLLLAPALFMLQVFDRVLSSGSQHETLAVLLIGVAVALTIVCVMDHLRSRPQGVTGQIVHDALSPQVAATFLRSRARPEGAGAMNDPLRDERMALQYLLEPLLQSLQRAGRER